MGYEGQDFSDIAGNVSPAFIDALYARFKESPDSVETGWRGFFEGLEGSMTAPSWQSKRWPLTTTDDLTAGLDPTQMEPAPKPAKGGKPVGARLHAGSSAEGLTRRGLRPPKQGRE